MQAFKRQRFEDATREARDALCQELARTISASLAEAEDFHKEVRRIVDALRAVGHDLWSIDESDEFEVWGPDYNQPGGPGLLITFELGGDIEVDWVREQ